MGIYQFVTVPDSTVASGENDTGDTLGSLTNILSSKVYDVAIESPLELATKLSERLGVNFWIQREDLQPVFPFKICGAYNMMAKIPRVQLDRGFICSFAGNHAQGVAISAKNLGFDAVIAMPVTTPEIKLTIPIALALDHVKYITWSLLVDSGNLLKEVTWVLAFFCSDEMVDALNNFLSCAS